MYIPIPLTFLQVYPVYFVPAIVHVPPSTVVSSGCTMLAQGRSHKIANKFSLMLRILFRDGPARIQGNR